MQAAAKSLGDTSALVEKAMKQLCIVVFSSALKASAAGTDPAVGANSLPHGASRRSCVGEPSCRSHYSLRWLASSVLREKPS